MFVLEGVGGDARGGPSKRGAEEGAAGELLGELDAIVLGAFGEVGGGGSGDRV